MDRLDRLVTPTEKGNCIATSIPFIFRSSRLCTQVLSTFWPFWRVFCQVGLLFLGLLSPFHFDKDFNNDSSCVLFCFGMSAFFVFFFSISNGVQNISKLNDIRWGKIPCYDSCPNCDPANSCDWTSCHDDVAFTRYMISKFRAVISKIENRRRLRAVAGVLPSSLPL